jgi:hypothetical protein
MAGAFHTTTTVLPAATATAVFSPAQLGTYDLVVVCTATFGLGDSAANALAANSAPFPANTIVHFQAKVPNSNPAAALYAYSTAGGNITVLEGA